MSNLSGNAYPSLVLERTMGVPPGGPRCVPIELDFAVSASYTIDYSNMQDRNWLRMVQAIWVDNAASAVGMTITVYSTGQVLQVPSLSQGYFALIAANPVKLTFASTGGVLLKVILLNFPVATATWKV